MGCGSSKPQPGEVPQQPVTTNVNGAVVKPELHPSDATNGAAGPAPPPPAAPLPPDSAPPSEEDEGLVWNLDEEEIATLSTVKRLEHIKE